MLVFAPLRCVSLQHADVHYSTRRTIPLNTPKSLYLGSPQQRDTTCSGSLDYAAGSPLSQRGAKRESGETPELPRSGKRERTPNKRTDTRWEATASRNRDLNMTRRFRSVNSP